VIDAGLHSSELILYGEDDPAYGLPGSDVKGRCGPAELFQPEAAIVWVVDEVAVIIPVDELAVETGQECKGCHDDEYGHQQRRHPAGRRNDVGDWDLSIFPGPLPFHSYIRLVGLLFVSSPSPSETA